ncbi:hypothetical protein [Pedobacter sp.]|uniref:hypothetical protein n=1 Tax=Pedobacter sp. TaxID=1411316 RepID=UPI003BAD8056
MRKTLISCLLIALALCSNAQIDTVSFPKERMEIRALLLDPALRIQTQKNCHDLISVGPKGDINYSVNQWRDTQAKEKLVFKSVKVMPGTEVIRIYGSTTAVVNWLADVQINVQGQDISLKVRRLEVFVKKDKNWCMVAGQGTQVDEKLFPSIK